MKTSGAATSVHDASSERSRPSASADWQISSLILVHPKGRTPSAEVKFPTYAGADDRTRWLFFGGLSPSLSVFGPSQKWAGASQGQHPPWVMGALVFARRTSTLSQPRRTQELCALNDITQQSCVSWPAIASSPAVVAATVESIAAPTSRMG